MNTIQDKVNKDNENKFVIIYDWMIKELELTKTEAYVYAIVYSFTKDGYGTFYASLETLAERVGSDKAYMSRTLNRLTEAGLLKKTTVRQPNGDMTSYEINKEYVIEPKSSEKEERPIGVVKNTTVQKSQNETCCENDNDIEKDAVVKKTTPVVKKTTNNNIYNNTNNKFILSPEGEKETKNLKFMTKEAGDVLLPYLGISEDDFCQKDNLVCFYENWIDKLLSVDNCGKTIFDFLQNLGLGYDDATGTIIVVNKNNFVPTDTSVDTTKIPLQTNENSPRNGFLSKVRELSTRPGNQTKGSSVSSSENKPLSDSQLVKKHFLENKKKLFDAGKVPSAAEAVNNQVINTRISDLFKSGVTVEQFYSVLDYMATQQWHVETVGYRLSVLLSNSVFFRVLNDPKAIPVKKPEMKNIRQRTPEEIFGVCKKCGEVLNSFGTCTFCD